MAWDRARTAKWLVISIIITVGGTVLLWSVFGPGALFGFLFLPLLPFAFGGGRRSDHDAPYRVRSCPRCDFASAEPDVHYCPRDGAPLV